jgi:hypothetical protein
VNSHHHTKEQLNSSSNNPKYDSISSTEKDVEYYRVVYPHRANTRGSDSSEHTTADELTVELNEIVKLVEDDADALDYERSWIKVLNGQGIVGMIPAHCVEPVLDDQLDGYVFVRRPTCVGAFAGEPWYYGNIARFDAILLLNKYAVNGDYLLRDSDVIHLSFFL